MKRFAAVAPAVVALAAFTLSACGSTATTQEATVTASAVPSSAATPGNTVIDISVTATKATANTNSVQAALNAPVTLRITAASAGELHVHSTPEKHVSFPAGTSQVTLTFTVPGTIEVEDHALDQKIVQIQVR